MHWCMPLLSNCGTTQLWGFAKCHGFGRYFQIVKSRNSRNLDWDKSLSHYLHGYNKFIFQLCIWCILLLSNCCTTQLWRAELLWGLSYASSLSCIIILMRMTMMMHMLKIVTFLINMTIITARMFKLKVRRWRISPNYRRWGSCIKILINQYHWSHGTPSLPHRFSHRCLKTSLSYGQL